MHADSLASFSDPKSEAWMEARTLDFHEVLQVIRLPVGSRPNLEKSCPGSNPSGWNWVLLEVFMKLCGSPVFRDLTGLGYPVGILAEQYDHGRREFGSRYKVVSCISALCYLSEGSQAMFWF